MRFPLAVSMLAVTSATFGQSCFPSWDPTFPGQCTYTNPVNTLLSVDVDGAGPLTEGILFGGSAEMRFGDTGPSNLIFYDGTTFSLWSPPLTGTITSLAKLTTPSQTTILAHVDPSSVMRLESGGWTPLVGIPAGATVVSLSAILNGTRGPNVVIVARTSNVQKVLLETDGFNVRQIATLAIPGALLPWCTYVDRDDVGPLPGELWVSGQFTSIDGVPFPGRAIWDGASWRDWPVGIDGVISSSAAIDLDGPGPEPLSIIAAGDVGVVGEAGPRGLVRWNGQAWERVPLRAGVRFLDPSYYLPTIQGIDTSVEPGATALAVNGKFFDDVTGSSLGASAIRESDGEWRHFPELVALGRAESASFPAPRGHSTVARVELTEPDPVVQNANAAVLEGDAWRPVATYLMPYPKGVRGNVNALTIFDPPPSDAGDPPPQMIAGGSFTHCVLDLRSIGAFVDERWTPLGSGVAGTVYALLSCDLDSNPATPEVLVVGGLFEQAGGQPALNVAVWDGSTWSALGPGPGGLNGLPVAIRALARYDPDGAGPLPAQLIAGGDTVPVNDPITGASLFSWSGTEWSALPIRAGRVNALEVFDDDGPGAQLRRLWIGGVGFRFLGETSSASRSVILWDGSSFSDVPRLNGRPIIDEEMLDFTIGDLDGPGGDPPALFLAGWDHVTLPDGSVSRKVLAWNGTRWIGFPNGPNLYTQAVHVFDPDDGGPAAPLLIAAGGFNRVGESTSVRGIAAWDGTWRSLGEDWIGNGIALASMPVRIGNTSRPALYVGSGFYNQFTRWMCLSDTPVCRGDHDHDADADVADIFSFLQAYFGRDPSADANGDGGVTLDDIFTFLHDWFIGCG